MSDTLESRAANVIRGLAMDGPHAARSGHQGTAMALAPLATVLWSRVLRYDPVDPSWANRDRFVLSAGHASILLYSMLHLTGYDLTETDLRAFRQWGSRTPGHPEAGHTAGVEVTTGPLGQGFANGVGMAIAEANLRARFGPDIFDHRVYAVCGDGDLQEGISHEAASLAGHLGLGRMIYVYDDNHITIDGTTDLSSSDDAVKRFLAYGWQVLDIGEAAEDVDAIEQALRKAEEDEDRPSLIVLRSHIAWPSPTHTDTAAAHGLAFDTDDITETKQVMGLPDEPFHIPDEVREFFAEAGSRHRQDRLDWMDRSAAAASTDAALAAVLGNRARSDLSLELPQFEVGASVATRNASNACLRELVEVIPGLMAGGADLTGNTGTSLPNEIPFTASSPEGRQLYFGIREHAMAAVLNGLAQHGGILPVAGTFFVFADYLRPAVRLASLMQSHVIHCWTHDSVGVGEDGPTHQPVEHLASLRAMPGLTMIRPADANETASAWRVAIERSGPIGLVLTRQNVPVLNGTSDGALHRGAYTLVPGDDPSIVLIGTGSEVSLCVDAAKRLADEGVRASVVSMPSWELFEEQDIHYRESVLPPDLPALSVEAACTFGWSRWADDSIGIDRFGASAPAEEVMHHLGITVDHIVERARALL